MEVDIPVEFHVEASNSQLEGVEVVERVEGESSDCRCACECLQKLG